MAYVTSVTTSATIFKGTRGGTSFIGDAPTFQMYQYLRIDANPRIALPRPGITMFIPPGSSVLAKGCGTVKESQ
jgi:hypothetical protein